MLPERTAPALPDAALEAAMRLFWEMGYEATSVEMLVARTGLHRAALYASHRSKGRLYEALLRRYQAQVLGPEMEPIAPLEASLEGVKLFFARLGERAEGPEGRLGCLMVQAAAGPTPPGVARIVEGHRAELRSRLARALRNAQLRGEVSGDVEPGAAADFLTAARMGLMALARSPAPRTAVRHSAQGVLDWLGRAG
jgi:AcrR family transcriptional regulator